jgi:PAS domain-containing protein
MVTVVAADGQPRFLRGLMLDVTARHQAEAALVRQKEELVLAMELASLGRWDFVPTTRHIVLDDALCRLLRTTPEEQGGVSMPVEVYAETFLPDDARELMSGAMTDAVNAPGPEYINQMEHRCRRADGSIAFVCPVC